MNFVFELIETTVHGEYKRKRRSSFAKTSAASNKRKNFIESSNSGDEQIIENSKYIRITRKKNQEWGTIDALNSVEEENDSSDHLTSQSGVIASYCEINMPSKSISVNEELPTTVIENLISPLIEEQKITATQLKTLTKTMNDLKGSVIEIKRLCELSSSATCSNVQIDFDNEDEIKLPCPQITDFEKFEEKLKSDETYRSKIVRKLLTQVNTHQPMVKSVGTMMRLVMSREVALQYNFRKPNDKKTKLLIETQLYKVLKGVLVRKFSKSDKEPLPDAVINDSISSILCHCGDWSGGRNNRKKITEQSKICKQ